MAFRRFRRKFNGRWFPTNTATLANTILATKATSWDLSVVFAVQGLEGPGVNATTQATMATAPVPMQTLVGPGSSYLVKRIVGDLDVAAWQEPNFDSHGFAFFGIAVDRTDAAGTIQNVSAWTPFGVGVEAIANMQKRWLYRRFWHLGNSASTVLLHDPVFPPYAASWYGSNQTGTHVDMKVKARVTYEERLFSIFAVTGGSAQVADGTQFTCSLYNNLRLFAYPTMRDNR